MSEFISVFPQTVSLDPHKRVNYEHGLVLGVDEFNQQEYYLLEKDRLHNRSLHGFGTVCGLQVSQENLAGGTEIKVSPGLAVTPSGQDIQVPLEQCARLEDWLAAHSAEVEEIIAGSPPLENLSLYLMLCYRECKTDFVPIPSGPCQSLEETTAPSRIADDFSLTFELQPPPESHFQSSMQALTQLLLSIPVAAGGTVTLDEIKELVRSLKPDDTPSSPPEPPPVISGSIAPENVEEFFSAALLIWVTEVKPCLVDEGIEIIPAESYQQCVFLAQFNITVEIVDGVAILQNGSAVEIDESLRLFLLPTQGMQNSIAPLMAAMKNVAALGGGGGGGVAIDETLLLHVAGAETINGTKTFASPIILAGTGRVRKTICLPGYEGHTGTGATKSLFSKALPSMHFMASGTNAFKGEGLFSVGVPDDIDLTAPMRIRLTWGFQGSPSPADISFNWNVGAHWFAHDEPIGSSPFDFIEIKVSERDASRNNVLVTDYSEFHPSVVLDKSHQYGAIYISILDPGVAIPEVYLLQVELEYTANRLGGRVTP